RDSLGAPGEAAASSAGAPGRKGRRGAAAGGRRPGDRSDEPRPPGRGRGRPIPTRSLLSPVRFPDRAAPTAGATGGHRVAGGPLSRGGGAPVELPGGTADRRCPRAADGL